MHMKRGWKRGVHEETPVMLMLWMGRVRDELASLGSHALPKYFLRTTTRVISVQVVRNVPRAKFRIIERDGILHMSMGNLNLKLSDHDTFLVNNSNSFGQRGNACQRKPETKNNNLAKLRKLGFEGLYLGICAWTTLGGNFEQTDASECI